MTTSRGPIRKFPIATILQSFGAQVGNYKTGKQKIRCPFHDDSRPSAQVDFSNNRFRCYGCGVGGDALDLLVSQEGLSLSAAISRAEALTGETAAEVRQAQPEAPALFARTRSGRGSG